MCDLEVANSLGGLVRGRLLPGARADEALALYLSLPLERHDHRALMGRVWTLRSNFTAYDAAYVALAEALGAAVLTLDGTLARAIARHARVAVVSP